MSCSVGVCFLPGGLGDYSYEQLLEHADLALYRAKIAGRNQYAVGEKLIPLDTGNKGETAVKLLMDETMEKRSSRSISSRRFRYIIIRLWSRGSGALAKT